MAKLALGWFPLGLGLVVMWLSYLNFHCLRLSLLLIIVQSVAIQQRKEENKMDAGKLQNMEVNLKLIT